METTSAQYKRLYYQSGHRGTKELDIILGAFAEQHLETLNPQELQDYEQLLQQEETALFAWLTNQEQPPATINILLLEKIKAAVKVRFAQQ